MHIHDFFPSFLLFLFFLLCAVDLRILRSCVSPPPTNNILQDHSRLVLEVEIGRRTSFSRLQHLHHLLTSITTAPTYPCHLNLSGEKPARNSLPLTISSTPHTPAFGEATTPSTPRECPTRHRPRPQGWPTRRRRPPPPQNLPALSEINRPA